MATITINYDSNNALAKSIINLIHTVGVFKIKEDTEHTSSVADKKKSTRAKKAIAKSEKEKNMSFDALSPSVKSSISKSRKGKGIVVCESAKDMFNKLGI